MKLEGKTLVITGGANGIGRELVLQALRGGARVAAVDVRDDSLQVLVQDANAGPRLSTHVVDVCARDRVFGLPDQVVAHHGAVDGLINNAGIIHPFEPICGLDAADIGRVIDVNLRGTLHMLQAFVPVLVRRPEGHVVNVASMGAFVPVPGQAIYCATKAAVKLATEALYAELIDTRVGVTVVMPGAIRTDITGNSGVQAPAQADPSTVPMMPPAAVARATLRAIERGQLHVRVGPDARVMSVVMGVAPRAAIRLIHSRMKKLLPSLAAVDG